jgi:hypothetical protein
VYVLHAGESVFRLQFLPDGRRLLVGLQSAQGMAAFEVWTLPDGARLALPPLRVRVLLSQDCTYAVVVYPDGECCYAAWDGGLFSMRTADGAPRPLSEGVRAHADALEDAGCAHAELLAHCRRPGERVRGCWAVDLVLGRG